MEHLEPLGKLKKGNEIYLSMRMNPGDISAAVRAKTAREGQTPYAVVVTCSDSRVIPEAIFSCGIGEIFVIRVAGNALSFDSDGGELGSIEYAVDHLGARLVLVLGHTKCGAVAAALEGHAEGKVGYIVERIKNAIGAEKDADAACRLNVQKSVAEIKRDALIKAEVHGAVYDIASGRVEFLS